MEADQSILKEKLLTLFHEEWYRAMKDYLHSPNFLSIGSKLAQMRKYSTIYPSSDKVFRIFKELPLSNVRVCLIGLDPYNTPNTACGHSFCGCGAHIVPPSLKIIHKQIELEYPELTDRFVMPFGGIDKWDLSYLVKQGVFLWNTALTVEKSKPESHIDLWKPFTVRVIEELNKQSFLIYILLGKKVQEYENIINSKHICIKIDIYNSNINLINSGIFRQINSHLDRMGKLKIIW